MNYLTEPLRQAVIDRIHECLALAKNQGVLLSRPTIRFDIKGSKGGTANWVKNELRFNPVLLSENPQEFIRQIVAHEVAHLVARKKHFGKLIKPHGPEWKMVMRSFGLLPDRCHSFDVSTVARGQTATFAYKCGCKTYRLSAIRHARVPTAQYRCAKCKVRLVLVPTTTARGGTVPSTKKSPSPVAPIKPSSGHPPVNRAPTEPMLLYAKRLSAQHHVPLPTDVTQSYMACARFIDKLKQAGPPGDRVPGLPTPKQLELAKTFSAITGSAVPLTTLRDRQLMSQWLSGQSEAMRKQRELG